MAETVMGLSSEADGELDMEIETPGTPIAVDLDGTVPLTSVYIGLQKVSPRSKQFELTFQDRHGMAWSDYNEDGVMDVFISRGALSGQLRLLPKSVEDGIQDELIVSEGPGRYKNIVKEVGIDKRGCSGRKVNWVDFNRDGLLDLYIDCQDRGNVTTEGNYPKQLYRQNPDKHFVDVAAEVGLDIPDHEVTDFVWFDADNDGYIDLLTSEDTGFYLYRNHAGKSFTSAAASSPGPTIPSSKGSPKNTGSSTASWRLPIFAGTESSTCSRLPRPVTPCCSTTAAGSFRSSTQRPLVYRTRA